jgi:spermidine synthase
VVGARVLAERSGPLGLLTVVESPQVPFRYVPGLSLNTRFLPADQLAVFTDGEGISVINAFDGDASSLGFLGDVTAALPYRLLDQPRVLVLGAGAGSDVLLALFNGAVGVDAVELNPQMVALLREDFAGFAGNLYDDERVSVHIGEARGFVSRAAGRFDLVQVALLDSPAVSGSGVQALSENYLYTVEAVSRYLDRLQPGGLLAVTRWLKVPPRDSLKLAATVIEAMRRSGAAEPGRRLVVIRGWNSMTLLAKNGEFDEREVGIVREFARQHSFDTAWYPDMPAGEANRFNRLDQPWLFEGINALLGDQSAAYIDNYKFDIAPATDQQPYFFNFFKWRALPEIMALRQRGGAGLVEWGYLVLLATLLQALIAGAVLILLPLAFAPRAWPPGTGGTMGGYFFLLGLAFLFVEMAFMQKFILFLSHPLYSVAVVLAGFLVFAGLGSAACGHLARRLGGRLDSAVRMAVTGIAALVLLYLWLLPLLFERLIGLGDAARVLIALALIAPLAFCMGMPFPLGLRRLSGEAPGFIPWAWGVNGFASVISAALATLLAVGFGFVAVLLAAVCLYMVAAALFRARVRTSVLKP